MVTAPVVCVLVIVSVEMAAVFFAEAEFLCLSRRHIAIMTMLLGLAGGHATVPGVIVVMSGRSLRRKSTGDKEHYGTQNELGERASEVHWDSLHWGESRADVDYISRCRGAGIIRAR
jgi:hypothetical protein